MEGEEGKEEGEEGERINHIQSCGCHGYFFAVETDGGVANSEVGHEHIVKPLFNNIREEEGTVVQRVVETTQNLSETREEERKGGRKYQSHNNYSRTSPQKSKSWYSD